MNFTKYFLFHISPCLYRCSTAVSSCLCSWTKKRRWSFSKESASTLINKKKAMRTNRVGYRNPVPLRPVPPGPKRNAHFGASFRCLSRLKLKKAIILNFSGDSALSAGHSLSFNFDSGAMRGVRLREHCGAHQRSGWARRGDRHRSPWTHGDRWWQEQP